MILFKFFNCEKFINIIFIIGSIEDLEMKSLSQCIETIDLNEFLSTHYISLPDYFIFYTNYDAIVDHI